MCLQLMVHPCRKNLSEVLDVKQDLAELLNKVQRHTKCTEGYCLKRDKKCRFKFPFNLEEKSRIEVMENGDIEFVSARNDPRLNKFNDYVIGIWRANMDISPVVSLRALINYLCKYISKCEPQSNALKDLARTLIERADDERGRYRSVKSIVQSLIIRCCSDRDFSAQEVCHLLMSSKLYFAGGRKFVKVIFANDEEWMRVDQATEQKSFVLKYVERSQNLEHDWLWKVAVEYDLPSEKRHRKSNIVQVFPLRKFNSEPLANNEEFYKQQILLYLPWRSMNDMKVGNELWEDVYERNFSVIRRRSVCKECDVSAERMEGDDEDEAPVGNDYFVTEEWMSLSQMGPNQQVEKVSLGHRESDLAFDWHRALQFYVEYGGIAGLSRFLSDQKMLASGTERNSEVNYEMPNVIFTHEQETLLKLFRRQLSLLQHDTAFGDVPKKVIVQGCAGTGKSLVIGFMRKLCFETFGENAILLLGPTGVSALNINGMTIHSALHINWKNEFLPLSGLALLEFKKLLSDVKMIIMDEYSMIGCKMLNLVDQRLRQGKDCDEPFGGLVVYMFGDVKQLAPVGDTPAYAVSAFDIDAAKGKMLYDSFDGSCMLSVVKRQSDVGFQSLLCNLSTGNLSLDDYELLRTRFKSSVSASERESFRDAMHLFSTRPKVKFFNESSLEGLRDVTTNCPVPVVKLTATHNCAQAAAGSVDDAEGLEKEIFLAEGAKIMLKTNLWTERGLVNGSVGKIHHIIYSESANPLEDLPSVLICEFDSYKGPYLVDKLVPINPLTKYWSKKGQSCSRTNFPVTLAYACTIHKSQGLSLDKVVVDLGSKEFPGGSYTAVSRCRTFTGILFEPFSRERLFNIKNKPYIQQRKSWESELKDKQISFSS